MIDFVYSFTFIANSARRASLTVVSLTTGFRKMVVTYESISYYLIKHVTILRVHSNRVFNSRCFLKMWARTHPDKSNSRENLPVTFKTHLKEKNAELNLQLGFYFKNPLEMTAISKDRVYRRWPNWTFLKITRRPGTARNAHMFWFQLWQSIRQQHFKSH